MVKKFILITLLGATTSQCLGMYGNGQFVPQASLWQKGISSVKNFCLDHKKGILFTAGGITAIFITKKLINKYHKWQKERALERERERQRERERREREKKQQIERERKEREELRNTAQAYLENKEKEYASILQEKHENLLNVIRKTHSAHTYPLLTYVKQLDSEMYELEKRYKVVLDETLKNNLYRFKETLKSLKNTITATKDYQKNRQDQERDYQLELLKNKEREHELELERLKNKVHHHYHHTYSCDHSYCPSCYNYYHGSWCPHCHHSTIIVKPEPRVIYQQPVIKETKIYHTQSQTSSPQPTIERAPSSSTSKPQRQSWFKRHSGSDCKKCMDASQTFFGGSFGS